MNSSNAFFVQSFDNFGRNACNQRVRRNDGALGYNGAGSNNGAVTDYSTVKHGGMHTDEAVVLNSAGMQQSAVAYGYIIAYDAGGFVGNVQYAVVLDVAVTANLDAVNVTADPLYYIMPPRVFFSLTS